MSLIFQRSGVCAGAAAVIACMSVAPASAALSRAQRLDKAEGQASFQCFVHDCSSRKVLAVLGPKAGKMTFRYRYRGMHNVHAHAFYSRCDQLIVVNGVGTTTATRFYNCA